MTSMAEINAKVVAKADRRMPQRGRPVQFRGRPFTAMSRAELIEALAEALDTIETAKPGLSYGFLRIGRPNVDEGRDA